MTEASQACPPRSSRCRTSEDADAALSFLVGQSMVVVDGDVIYSVGIVFHLARVRFQEAIWHSFVLVAAACHYAAIVQVGA
jgi:channel protein (hemolysin III family)